MENKPTYTNALIKESSPYLLQHAHNPVEWHAWNTATLEKARKENKLILISIGYAACHWCHVMEHQSFEDEQVAELMNKHFINIKVDREERPDIDQIYMNAVHLITGAGGWPLNCFALPDGSPVYGGTYFPKERWTQVLQYLAELWETNPEKLSEQANHLKEGIQEQDFIGKAEEKASFTQENLHHIVNKWKSNFDTLHGGENQAPKFPMPNNYQFLLRYTHHQNTRKVDEHITNTLTKMAYGGIFDHVGGGFARYSVDELWKVPHFEKMLYDNAQLISLYSEAFQFIKDALFKNVVEKTIDFLQNHMLSPEGGFYSSFDADSEGVEGKYYTWTKEAIERILPNEDIDLFCSYFNITQEGNWEDGRNILFMIKPPEEIARQYEVSENELNLCINRCLDSLKEERHKRIPPALDDKILTSWNGLVLRGLVDAYRVFEKEAYLNLALKNAAFIRDKVMKDDYRLDRNYKNGKSTINGFLDDYAFVIDGFIGLYQMTGDEPWLHVSRELTEHTIRHFYDKNSGLFYYTSDLDDALIVRKMELSDNVIPASNSTMAKNLFVLGKYYAHEVYTGMAHQMLSNVKEQVLRYNRFYSNWATLMIWFVYEPYEVAIAGNHARQLLSQFNNHFLPDTIWAFSSKPSDIPLLQQRYKEDKTLIYVCRNNTCKQPVESFDEAIIQMEF